MIYMRKAKNVEKVQWNGEECGIEAGETDTRGVMATPNAATRQRTVAGVGCAERAEGCEAVWWENKRRWGAPENKTVLGGNHGAVEYRELLN